eukprot:175761_1
MAEQKKKVVVTKKYFENVILNVDDTKYEIVEVKRRKEFVKTVFGPHNNETDKPIYVPYKKTKMDKINDVLPLKLLKNDLKIKNISFFIETLDPSDNDDNKADDILATFEIGPQREGWITRDYQRMVLIGYPVDTGSYIEENKREWKFEYPKKGGKLLTKTRPLKK